MKTKLSDLIEMDANVTLAITPQDLKRWLHEVTHEVKKQLEDSIEKQHSEVLLEINQVAEILGVTRMTLYNWDKKGYLKVIEIGGKRRYKMSDIQQLINQNENE